MGIAIYVRQSLEKKDSLSLEGQVDICKKQLTEGEQFEIYEDSGFSGKNINRPAMEKLLNDIESGIISKVICYKLDRISRSILDFNKLLVLFQKNKVEFVSCTENLDTTSPMGRAMVNIVATFAQLERETIQERVKDNYYKRGTTGAFLGGTIPYGFNRTYTQINGKKAPMLERDDEQAEVVELMFELYANSSMSLGDVAKHINKLGISSANGKRWNSNTISRMLKSPLYVKANADVYNYYKIKGVSITNEIDDFEGFNGCFLYGKREANERRYTNVKDHYLSIALHEGFVESRLFLKCQAKLDSNQQLCNSGKGKHTWLTGVLKCGKCGYSMSAVKNSTGKKYLVCKGKSNQANCEGHKNAIILQDIEDIVEPKIVKKLKELSEIKINTEVKQNRKVNEIKIQISKIDEDINKIMEKLLEANNIVMSYINKKIQELDEQKKILYAKMQKENNSDDNLKSIKEVIEKAIDFESLSFENKKDVVKLLIDKVEIADTKVKITWRI
ncbi:recombinase family protein [Clostridium tertium]|uniref:Recombinase family protein n=1 Tax=Clostridium tertium TaxID=1559 RepID=A0A9X3XPK8_9CLOT|nr:recombinase family protein [Clostridium tertium]MDC4241829.1 recombinase family protein [Clostridium tertium]